MKVGGGLYYVTGPMGSGKSLFGVRQGVDAITHGRYWVTNQRLYPDAFLRMAKHNLRFGSTDKFYKLAAAYERYYIFETDLEEAMRYRPPGKGEARALFTWDETHNDLNNRSYRERHDKDGGSTIMWATQLRKLGFIGFLLSQHHGNTDAQLRRIANGIVMLVNQREQHRILGMRVKIMPPLFLAYWLPITGVGNGPITPWKVDRYPLSWHKKLYDTHDLYHGVYTMDEDGSAIYLPEGGRRIVATATPPTPIEHEKDQAA